MIRIESEPWQAMVSHARQTYPTSAAAPCSAHRRAAGKSCRACPGKRLRGVQSARYELRPQDLLAAGGIARERHMDLIGIYHSHPDCPACFSPPICGIPTRGIPSCALHSEGEFHHATSWLPNSSRPKPPGGVDLLKIRGTKATESEIDVTEVKAKLDRGDHFVLIDVREPHEYTICHIPRPADPAGEVPKR